MPLKGGSEWFQSLLTYLEDMMSFPSIKHLVFELEFGGDFLNKLQNICRRRNIQLQEYHSKRILIASFLI